MNPVVPTGEQSTDDVADLRARLAEAGEILRAIRSGDVDAVVVQGARGDQLFTLKGADEPYRVLIEEMNQGAVTLSADGSILYANRRFAELLKRPLEDIVGLAFGEFVAPDERASFAALLEAGRTAGSAGAITLAAADASAVPLQLALGPLPAESPAAICLVATDIRESRDKEARLRATMADLVRAEREAIAARADAERANAAKDQFLSRMSHELRTPMNAVLGFAQVLDLDETDAGKRESLEQILHGGRHLLGLIDEVLDFSTIDAGRLRLSLGPVRVQDVLEECVTRIAPLAATHGVSLHGRGAGDGRLHVFADRSRVTQVLMHLLANAVKYNRATGSVSLSCERTAAGRGRINVSDTGHGIAAADLPRLFTAFERLNAARLGVDGTGLGLALAKKLVDVMGGAIGADSVVGEGSVFWVDLPLADDPATALEGVDQPQPPADARPDASRTVLYIEDNLSNVRLVERLMARRPGVDVITAIQGGLGVDLAREHRPALILLDLHLPDMHGSEVLARLQSDPVTRACPVVVISADATPGEIARLRGAGAAEYLTKPLDVRKFFAVLDEALGM